eukprot:TRINITY_DN9689_c0_g1_i1.p1 TRINITY_DN9689_c0_g1~~TRINITY_DN9689_c0_g1_i1.p1  ORF type:complete len:291 (-),score=54.17 TRINITY_DN9689_c0_g1_i1:312-1184(-)
MAVTAVAAAAPFFVSAAARRNAISQKLRSPLHITLRFQCPTLASNFVFLSKRSPRRFQRQAATISESSTAEEEDNSQVQQRQADEEIEQTEGGGGGERNSSSGKGDKEHLPPGTRVFVGNLPYNCDSAELAGIVQNFGSVEIVEVLYDKSSGLSRGFGFVTMSTVEDADTLIKGLDGCEYGGRTLRVNLPDKPKQRDKMLFEVFVGNLAWGVNSDSLMRLFSKESSPMNGRVVYDAQTGRSKGYGFISYSSLAEAEAAAQCFNGKEFQGRSLRVHVADATKRMVEKSGVA